MLIKDDARLLFESFVDYAITKRKGPAFKKGGTTTAGNSSQTTDGAAMVLMASRKKARELGLPILGKLVAFTVAGCEPEIMGIGPAVAIPKVMLYIICRLSSFNRSDSLSIWALFACVQS